MTLVRLLGYLDARREQLSAARAFSPEAVAQVEMIDEITKYIREAE